MAAVTAAVAAVGSVAVGAAAASSQRRAANRAQASADAANANSQELAWLQEERAAEQWEDYKTNYQPIEHAYLEQAKNYGSVANQERAATNAAAASKNAYSSARDQLNKAPGLDPNSQQYLRESNRIGLAEAATSAAQQTTARQEVADKGAAMLASAAGKGVVLSSNSTSALNAASAAQQGVANSAQYAANAAASRASSAAQGLGYAVGGLFNNSTVRSGFSQIGSAISGMFAPPAMNQVNGIALNTATPSATYVPTA